jgi:hypothetical protein
MKKRLFYYCVAALMLASLFMPNAFFAPAAEHAAAQDRGKPKDPDRPPPKKKKGDRELTTKEKICDDCKKNQAYRLECYGPGHVQFCGVKYTACKNNCQLVPSDRRQACLEDCVAERDKCPETCLKNKCKEECEGVDDDPAEDN